MGVRIITPIVYGVDGSDIIVQPATYEDTVDPTTNDTGPEGSLWLNSVSQELFYLADSSTNTWISNASSGSGTFTAVTVNPGNLGVTAGDTTLGGDLTVAGLTTFNGDVDVASGTTFTISGDLDLSSAQLINLTSTLNADPAIYFLASGGTSEVIRIRSDQGTAANSIDLVSDVGGITLTATGLASNDAINLEATAGGIDMDAALDIDIASSQAVDDAIILTASAGGMWLNAAGGAGLDLDITNTAGSINIDAGESAADGIIIEASGAAGGVQIKAGTGGVLIGNEADTTTIDLGDIAATASRTITIAGGTQVTAATTDLVDIAPDGATTNADSVKQVDICSGNVTTGQSLVNINGGTAASGTSTVNISAGTGGGTKAVNIGNADGLTTFNVDAITLINDSVNVNTSINTGTSTGVVAIGNAAAGALSMDTAAGISLDAATASNFTVTGAGADLTLSSVGGSVAVSSTEDAASAISLVTNGGTSETILLSAAQGTGADSINLSSTAGGITLTSNLASADGINLNAVGGGVDVDGALQVNIASSQAAVADSVRIVASAADGGIDIDAGTGGIALDSTGAYSIDGAAASNVSVSGAGIDLTLASAAGRVVVNGEEAAADAVRLLSAAGGMDADFASNVAIDSSAGNISLAAAAGTVLVDASGVVELNSSGAAISIGNDAVAQAINVGTGAAARTVTVGNTTGASAVDVNTGTGGFNVTSSGISTIDSVDNTIASPTASTTINANVGSATFTGFTTAAAGSQVFTFTNSLVSATSKIFCSASTLGGNDAQMTVTRILPAAGSFTVTLQNLGAAAVNGNIIVTFWVIG